MIPRGRTIVALLLTLYVVLVTLAGCSIVRPTPTPTAPSLATATLTPPDPPTSTPVVTPSALRCTIQATRTPPPGAPTYIPDGPQPHAPGDVVDPHVEVCLTASTIHTGDVVRVHAQAVDVGLPIYYFTATDQGSEDARLVIRVSPAIVNGQGEIIVEADTSQVLEFVQVEEVHWGMIFVLRARGLGETEISIWASGEVHYGYPGPAAWEGGGSDVFTISVTGS